MGDARMLRRRGGRLVFRTMLCLLVIPPLSCKGPTEELAASSSPEKPLREAAVPREEGTDKMAFQLSSTAFRDGESIPKKYTGDGADVSPPLTWTSPPEGAQSFALINDDPDAPVGTWVHWLIYGIPGGARQLAEAIPPNKELSDGAKQGRNDFRKIGYRGPAPPSRRATARPRPHRYFFKLYALDAAPGLTAGATKADVLKAIDGHVLAEAQLMGRYGR